MSDELYRISDDELVEVIKNIEWGLERHEQNKVYSNEAKDIEGWLKLLDSHRKLLRERERKRANG